MRRKHVLLTAMALIVLALTLTTGCEPQQETKDCVVMLGDSIFALSGEETKALEALSGETYRQYYISGAQMTGGLLVDTIPKQYNKAIAEGPIRTVILDGGGNDVLIGAQRDCSTSYGTNLSRACHQVIDNVAAVTRTMLDKMVADGVENIVWQGYYYTDNDQLWQVLEVSTERAIADMQRFQAEHPQIKAIYVDVRPYFDKNNARRYTTWDGIHPTKATSETLADVLWEAMVRNDIEQGVSCDGFNPGNGDGGCN
ncbi:SGNH/GDSL hydrolase family protein [Desulfatitalea alkaliphila]|uniref:SGNH/GDSL hydrolase family protein n=1 Tax=Desulfatitalea alkaliphila TaxID=2929485 RepID=A0AA41UKF8_9BACT|nr:SGNH/GDSL hydrolase family protein [Desulfatitalea alkaliphila]MCJ8500401.1 SGNH/GDSL hydrolase family protein [Desulfatitalea alkaliphila]